VVHVFAVIPARNEEQRIATVIRTVRQAGIRSIVVVVNGCTDRTLDVVRTLQNEDLTVLHFANPLGVDIPRAIGAAYAYRHGARHVLFYDGDLVGQHLDELRKLITSSTRFGIDLALTDSYGTAYETPQLRDLLLRLRRELNHKLGLEPRLGLANPAHGPCVVSRNLLREIPLDDLAQPPMVLARAAQNGLKIDALAHIPQARLGSAHKGPTHSGLIRETIIGDLLEALCLTHGRPVSREHRGLQYDGYHSARRFDLLRQFAKSLA
jgi:glycosyltransferase involved in cell wall biosynthesis